MGTIASPWRYDKALRGSTAPPRLRRPVRKQAAHDRRITFDGQQQRTGRRIRRTSMLLPIAQCGDRQVKCLIKGPMMTTDHSRITLDPAVLAGKPVIRGTRLSVQFVIGLMADGWKEADIMTNYPGITHDDVMACLAYARDTLSSEKVFPSAA
jgi:uncharacterized protein (DUF433 family)